MSFQDEKTIFIGGLKPVKNNELKGHLVNLFHQIGLVVNKQQIVIVNKSQDYIYAFVNLDDEEDVSFTLRHFDTPHHPSNVPFDFSLIHEESKTLKFNRKTTKTQFHTSNQNVGRSGLSPHYLQTFYKIGEKLGSETRNAEFKDGGFMKVPKKSIITETFGKYVCSFLNTDGGTLYIGVDDNGSVVGIACDHQEEDQYRLLIDDAIKRINPPVFPSSYTVKFSPVTGVRTGDLKVIQITVEKEPDKKQLYDFQGDVYVRRDASIQCLKARELQEWTRKQVEKEQKEAQQKLEQVSSQMQKISAHEQSEKESRLREFQQQYKMVKVENERLKSELHKEKMLKHEDTGKNFRYQEIQQQFVEVTAEHNKQLEQVTSEMQKLKSELRKKKMSESQHEKKESRLREIEQQFANLTAENHKLKYEIEEQKQLRLKPSKNRSKICSIM